VAEYVDSVARETRRADPSRLVTYCSYYYLWDKGFPHVDVISINEYFGWELGSLPVLSKMLDNIHRDWPHKPLIVSELGAQAHYGMHNPQPQLAGIVRSVLSKDLSEEHQALYLQSHMDTIWNRRAFINGMVVWGYADYRSGLNKARTSDMPPGLNACGIVTEDRKSKLSYEAVKERFGIFRSRSAVEIDGEEKLRQASK
jgi:beta-galactosidase